MFLILGSDSLGQTSLYGTKSGKPFASEAAAQRMANRLIKRYTRLDFQVMRLHEAPWQV